MKLRAGDSAKRIEDAVAAHSAGLLAFFARRIEPSHDAADLLAETLLILWKRASSLPARDEEVRPWMFGIARNVLLHHLRRSVRHRELADRLRNVLLTDPRAGFADSTEFDELHRALSTLDQIDRDIVGLVHWEGFALVEIACMLKMKEGTVRSRYHRARAALKSQLSAGVVEAAPGRQH